MGEKLRNILFPMILECEIRVKEDKRGEDNVIIIFLLKIMSSYGLRGQNGLQDL